LPSSLGGRNTGPPLSPPPMATLGTSRLPIRRVVVESARTWLVRSNVRLPGSTAFFRTSSLISTIFRLQFSPVEAP